MFNAEKSTDRLGNYRLMVAAVKSLVEDEQNIIACLSNASAIINFYMDTINWAGFYIFEESTGELVLGPFQGLPACMRIKIGLGVCGTAAGLGEVIVVPDVESFPGHIACDANSRSEIVLPLFNPDGSVYGVLDIDSPVANRFLAPERSALEEIVGFIGTLLTLQRRLL